MNKGPKDRSRTDNLHFAKCELYAKQTQAHFQMANHGKVNTSYKAQAEDSFMNMKPMGRLEPTTESPGRLSSKS